MKRDFVDNFHKKGHFNQLTNIILSLTLVKNIRSNMSCLLKSLMILSLKILNKTFNAKIKIQKTSSNNHFSQFFYLTQ